MANIKKNETKKKIVEESARREKTKVDETFDWECSSPEDDCGCTIDACGCVNTCMCC
jgi:hypothetical protein